MSTKRSKVTKKTNSKKLTRSARRGKKIATPNKPISCLVLIILGVAGLVLASFLMIYTVIGSRQPHTDAERFAAEYSNVSVDNPFVYRTGDEIVDILEHGTGIVYLGFPSCPWCQAYTGYLSDVAKEQGIDKIYYYNLEKDRLDNTELYQKLVSIIGPYLQFDEEGQRRIYVPNITFVVDGTIVANDNETSKYTAGESEPENYWTDARIADLKARLTSYMEKIKNAEGCTDSCNK